jgi:hypothetical protein
MSIDTLKCIEVDRVSVMPTRKNKAIGSKSGTALKLNPFDTSHTYLLA